MRIPNIRVIAALALFACGCAPIQHEQILARGPSSGVAGPGDLIARVDKERNLQNIFGAADIWGRKTQEGFTELRFAGVDAQGQAVLFRTDMNIQTNETTLSRSPFSSTFASANVSGSQVNAVATTIRPTSDYHAIVPAGALQIAIPKGTASFPFEGHTVQILSVTPTSLNFRVD